MNELNEKELEDLKSILKQITTRLPEDKAHYVWNTFNHIRGEREPQPCMCGSSGAHWKRAVDFLHDYAKNK
jgi:hypothetical protein